MLELLHVIEGVKADEVYHLIAQEQIYLDLTVAPLVESEKCLLFSDRITALSYSAITSSQAKNNTVMSPGGFNPWSSNLFELQITFSNKKK